MSEIVPELAAKIDPAVDAAKMRIALITSVEAPSPYRVKTDVTGTAWIARDRDMILSTGDRVVVIQQGEIYVVVAKLAGADLTPIGAITPYAGSAAPTGWLLCNGAAVSRTAYAALFAVCGTSFGTGDGSTTFNLPNLTNRVPVAAGGTYARAATGGAATVTLTEAQMPSHGHSMSGTANSAGDHGHSGSGSTGSAGGHSHSDNAASDRSIFPTGGATTAAFASSGTTGSAGDHSHSVSVSVGSGGSHSHSLSGTVGSAGSDSAHENMPPYLALTYIVKAL